MWVESELSSSGAWQASGIFHQVAPLVHQKGTTRAWSFLCMVWYLFIVHGVSLLTFRLSATTRAWWRYLDMQYLILFSESPRLGEQGLHLSLTLLLTSLHIFASVEVAFTTHGRQSASWGHWHLYLIPTDNANVDTRSIEDKFLPRFW